MCDETGTTEYSGLNTGFENRVNKQDEGGQRKDAIFKCSENYRWAAVPESALYELGDWGGGGGEGERV